MRIEKINDTQVKILLTQTDLSERNLKASELVVGSEKTQALFREVMERAMVECNFHVENTSLMIEAIPVSSDNIMIIVTKVATAEEPESRFDLAPQAKELNKYKANGLINVRKEYANEANISIFSFPTLDAATEASVRLLGVFSGTNRLFKNHDKFFLLLENDVLSDGLTTEDLEGILREYGQKHISTIMAKYYLEEHGEVIIKRNAVNILANI